MYTLYMTTLPHYLTTLDYLPLKNTFIPSEMPSEKLMILLHGRGGKAEDFVWMAEAFGFDDMHYLLLNAPDVYNDGYSWYDDMPQHTQDIEKASLLLSKTFDALFEKDFSASKSYLLGFSQGALLTFEFGARYEKSLAGYIAMSGQLSNPELLLLEMNSQLKNANWLCTHGTQDKALDFQTTKSQVETLKKGGFRITCKSYDKGHVVNIEEVEMLRQWIKKYSPST